MIGKKELFEAINSDISAGIKNHLLYLHYVTIALNAKFVVEIGTGLGASTIALLSACNEFRGHLFSIDIAPCQTVREKLSNEPNITFIQGDSLEVVKRWPDIPICHLFIDGLHTYEQVRQELIQWEKFVTRTGVITMHDIIAVPAVNNAMLDFIKMGGYKVTTYNFSAGLAVLMK